MRNILIRGAYTPPAAATAVTSGTSPKPAVPGADSAAAATGASDGADPFMAALRDGTLTADQLLQGYCARLHAQSVSYEETARRLDLDWRTVRAKVRAWAKRPQTATGDRPKSRRRSRRS